MDDFKKSGYHAVGEHSWKDYHEGIPSKLKAKARRISRHRLKAQDQILVYKSEVLEVE